MSQSYICAGSQTKFEGKPWITIDMPRWDQIPGPVTFSSYLTYRHNLDKLPHKHFELVVNKEDFNHIRPVISTPRKTEFRILTEGEIDLLTQSEYSQYKLDYEEQSCFNGIQDYVYESTLQNEEYIEQTSDETDSGIDDY